MPRKGQRGQIPRGQIPILEKVESNSHHEHHQLEGGSSSFLGSWHGPGPGHQKMAGKWEMSRGASLGNLNVGHPGRVGERGLENKEERKEIKREYGRP